MPLLGGNTQTATSLYVGHTRFPAVWKSQLCHYCTHQHLLHKNNLQLLAQMEVTPYASQPLSLCQGSQACARLSNNEEAREENGWCDCSLTCSVWLHQAIKDVPCASVQGVGSGACWILMPLNNGLSARSAPRSVQVFSGRVRQARQVNTQALNVIRPRAISSVTARMWICDSLWTGGVCVGAEKMSTHLLKELGPCLICEVTYVIKALNFWPAIVWKLCQYELTMSTCVDAKRNSEDF